MHHQNSLFHAVLKHVPWPVFDRLVARHEADKGVRRLSTKSQLVALLYGQLSGASSLREIEVALSSHESRLYHLGAAKPSRSTLADANARRPSAVFEGLFQALVRNSRRGARKTLGEAVHLVDSTGIRLSARWARFSADTCGAKVHVIYDPDAAQPIYAAMTRANVNDITAAKAMPIQQGATYVFDLGYYDYGWWAGLKAQGCRIVTRLKTNTPLHAAQARALPESPAGDATGHEAGSSEILSDRIGHLNARVANGKPNPYADPVREVRVRIATGKVLRIVSSDLEAPAQEIADLYKRRWQIELFFRWIKQTLKIKHFLGTTENAVRIQIMAALIAYLLLQMAKATQTAVNTPLAFARLVRANVMHRKNPDELLKPPKTNRAQSQQLCLQGI